MKKIQAGPTEGGHGEFANEMNAKLHDDAWQGQASPNKDVSDRYLKQKQSCGHENKPIR